MRKRKGVDRDQDAVGVPTPAKRRRKNASAAVAPSPQAMHAPPEDPLRAALFPVSNEDRERVFEIARQWLDKLDQVFPKLMPMCADVFRRALEFDDLDLCHFVFFICIPQIEPLAADLRRSISPARYERFIAYLTHCRTSFMFGLTRQHTKCLHASQAHFHSLRHFVWDVRRFYLFSSDVAPPVVGAGASESSSSSSSRTPAPATATAPVALWNHAEAHRFPHVGDGFFAIMAMHLQNLMWEDYSNHPFVKQPRYTSPSGQVVTTVERLTAQQSMRRAVDPVAHARTLFRDVPRAGNEWQRLRIVIHRPVATADNNLPTIPVVLDGSPPAQPPQVAPSSS